jgi:hypothetical protein
MAPRRNIWFGNFLERSVNINSFIATSRYRYHHGCIRDPRSPIQFLPGQSRGIFDSGSLCGKVARKCVPHCLKHLTTVYHVLDIQRSRVVHGLFAPTLRRSPFRGSSHRCGGLHIFSHHLDNCPRSRSVSSVRPCRSSTFFDEYDLVSVHWHQ